MVLPVKASSDVTSEAMESVLLGGDLSKLTPPQRVHYYQKVCESLGLNPLTRPLEYITLNGKLTLYAKRDCAEQLRRRYNVSLEVVSEEVADDVLTVHVRARLPDGRVDEDLGVVPFPATLKGEAKANQKLKAITKAKRRVTLSICGLGFLDESEVGSISNDVAEIEDSSDVEKITAEQAQELSVLIEDSGVGKARFLKTMNLANVEDLPAKNFVEVKKRLEDKKTAAVA
jgi:hypothetical protein